MHTGTVMRETRNVEVRRVILLRIARRVLFVHASRITHHVLPGTCSLSSVNHTSASEAPGPPQSPGGEDDPPEPTFGPFGTAERLNWLILKKPVKKNLQPFL